LENTGGSKVLIRTGYMSYCPRFGDKRCLFFTPSHSKNGYGNRFFIY
jgi:hypothetical protein